MKASEFNLKYKGYLVQVQVITGMYKGSSYNTVTTHNQAWTNHKHETLVIVKGLVSSVKLSDCTIVKATKIIK